MFKNSLFVMETGLAKVFGIFVLIILTSLVAARPQEQNKAETWSKDWNEEADWWDPDTRQTITELQNKNSWRAFPPSDAETDDKWWEKKQEEELWDPSTYNEKTNDHAVNENIDKTKDEDNKQELKVDNDIDDEESDDDQYDDEEEDESYDDDDDDDSEEWDDELDEADEDEDEDEDDTDDEMYDDDEDDSFTEDEYDESDEEIDDDDNDDEDDEEDDENKTEKKDKAPSDNYPSSFYPGELNAFVDPSPGYHNTHGESSWSPSYSRAFYGNRATDYPSKNKLAKKIGNKLENPDPKIDNSHKSSNTDNRLAVNSKKYSPSEAGLNSPKEFDSVKNSILTTASPNSNKQSREDSENTSNIYGKGLSIGGPTSESIEDNKDSKNKEEPFEDWPDWDPTLFESYDTDNEDDYDYDSEEDHETDVSNTEKTGEKSQSNTEKTLSNSIDEDVEYYDDYDEKDAKENKDKNTPQNIDELAIMNEEEMSKVNQEYNKGIIYDDSHPFHKSKLSVKKDLGSPVKKQTEKSVDTEMKGWSVTQFKETNKKHRIEDITSPNPPPSSTSTISYSESSSQSTSIYDIMMGDQPSGHANEYVQSFPLEFCKLKQECRAGRVCVEGVCKCDLAASCAQHYKPVCGSDGVLYPSHCELHRTACVSRVHIRIDHSASCLRKNIQQKERSWLLEEEEGIQSKEKGIQSEEEGKSDENNKSENLSQKEEYPYDNELSTGTDINTSSIKKSGQTIESKEVKECSWDDMKTFKEAMLMYYCRKFMEPDCKLEVKTDRNYLSMLMFNHYDEDFDFFLTASELDDKEREEHFSEKVIINCHLHDFVKFADTEQTDGKLSYNEFTNSFNKPILPTVPSIEMEIVQTMASEGNGLELKCGVEADDIIWKRHGTQLSDDTRSHQLMVFEDGSLFFSKVGLHHIGNYTCMNADDLSKTQVHKLRVQTTPLVEVTPVTQTHIAGSDIELWCHAEGIPRPKITWKKGGEAIFNGKRNATIYYGGGHLKISDSDPDRDSGTYTCSAHSQAGTTERFVSVSVKPRSVHFYQASAKNSGTFVIFNNQGISAIDPVHCLKRQQITGEFGNFKFIPEALDGVPRLCELGKDCKWGDAVKVGDSLIYASQPDQNRVVVMEAGGTWTPLQVIDTDMKPGKLWYVPHLDQVWILCSSHPELDGGKTVLVIRDASQHIQHRSVHTRPVGNHFDLVEDLFIAPVNDLHHDFEFGYVSHTARNGLFKINLEDMSYTKAIDLSNYGCIPQTVAFVPLGGHIVIECVSPSDQHSLQLTMDYLTDTITSTISLSGQPLTSPDSRHLITVDKFTGKVVVAAVSNEGLMETTYEVTVSASISDVTFMPSNNHHGYDLVLTSADDDDIIVINLNTGKVEKLKGSNYSDSSTPWHPSPIHRHVISGNAMSHFLLSPSRSSLAILDSKFKLVECEFRDVSASDAMIYIPA